MSYGYNPPTGPGYNAPTGPGYNAPNPASASWAQPTPPATTKTGRLGLNLASGAAPLKNMFGGTNAAQASASPHTMGTPNPTETPPSPYGSQSGPTAIEDRYNSRATGTDPGWEYATGRATDAINNAYAARGGYNSSGAIQSIGDMFSNATSQREGQLDTLANEATSAHQHSLDSMFNEGNTLASGQAGTQGAYDMASGDAQSQNLRNQLMLQLTRAGVDQKTAQSELDTIFGGAKIVTGALGGSGGK